MYITHSMVREAVRTIKQIQFELLKEQTILEESVVEIKNNTNTSQKSQTLFDTRLGTIDSDRCETCKAGRNYCTGHFGHYPLNIHCINSIMLKPLLSILSNICISCGNVLLFNGQKNYYKLDQDGMFHVKGNEWKGDCCKQKSHWMINCKHCKETKEFGIHDTLDCSDCNEPITEKKTTNIEQKIQLLNEIGVSRYCTECEFELSLKSPENYVDVVVCTECNTIQPYKYDEERMEIQKFTYNTAKKNDTRIEIISLDHLHDLLKKVKKEDYKKLGVSPKNSLTDLLIHTLPIPPPNIHPVNFNYSSGEDGLIMTINNIIKKNQILKKEIERSEKIRYHLEKWLTTDYKPNTSVRNVDREILELVTNGKKNSMQKYIDMGKNWTTAFIEDAKKQMSYSSSWIDNTRFYIYTMLQNDNTDNNKRKKIPVATNHKKHKLLGIKESISGKEGLIRKYIDGKRTDWGCRSPITGDPSLDIDEIGIPLIAAKKLYIEERVNFLNYERLQNMVKNGETYPGSEFVFRDGKKYIVRLFKERMGKNFELKMGDVVGRHMINGDIVFLNRQPTLHKHGLMVHRIRVNLDPKCLSLKINPIVCNPYNADFDGDEMTFHIPRTPYTTYESWVLANVPRMFILPRSNKPSYSVIQDVILGAHLLSLDETPMTREMVAEVLAHSNEWKGLLPSPAEDGYYYGRHILSYIWNKKFFCKIDDLRIMNGVFISGEINGKNIGATYNSLFQNIWDQFGEGELIHSFKRLNRVVNAWNMRIRGNSATYSDVYTTLDFIKQVDRLVKETFDQANLKKKEIEDEFDEISSSRLIDTSTSLLLNNVRNKVGVLCKRLVSHSNNNIYNMVSSGSKGSLVNIIQIIGLLGQQSIMGKRIELHDWTKRSLPHFLKWQNDPIARGFVRESYMMGLTSISYFFHSMAGREGLIDTAVKTARIGYISRKISKLMQEAIVWYDGSIRLGIKHRSILISPAYGYNNISSLHIWRKQVQLKKATDSQFESKWIWENKKLQQYSSIHWEEQELREIRKNDIEEIQVCFNLSSLLMEIQNDKKLGGAICTPLRASKTLMNFIYSIEIIPESLHHSSTLIRNINFKLGYEYKIHLLDQLSSKRVVEEHQLTIRQFNQLLKRIQHRIVHSRVDPGEPAGLLSSSSLGEPATQLNLNSFHQTGIHSRTNISTGIPMLKRLVEMNRDQEHANMVIFPLENNKENARYIAEKLRYVNLAKFVDTVNFIYDSEYPSKSEIRNAINSYRKNIETLLDIKMDPIPSSNCPWIVELIIRRKILFRRRMTVADLADIISERLGKMYNIYWVDENVARIHLQYKKSIPYSQLYNKIINKDLYVNIMGVKNISHAYVRYDEKEKWHVIDTNGSNLAEILIRDDIDERRTWSNSIVDTLHVLGIHATRSLLIKMVSDIFPMYIDPRHFHLLVDIMLHKATPLTANRFGVNKLNIGILNKIIFETPMEHLRNAAIGMLKDSTEGVNASSFFNTIPPIGTGMCDVIPYTEG